MLDIVFLALVLRAAFVALRERRFGIVAAAVVASSAYGVLVAVGLFARLFDGLGLMGMLLLVTIGPTDLLGACARIPGSAAIADHSVLAKCAIAALLIGVYAALMRRASAQPLSERSQVDEQVARPLLAAGLAALAVPLVSAIAALLEVPI